YFHFPFWRQKQLRCVVCPCLARKLRLVSSHALCFMCIARYCPLADNCRWSAQAACPQLREMDQGQVVRRSRSGQAARFENTRAVRRQSLEGIYSRDCARCDRPSDRRASGISCERCFAGGNELSPELALATRRMVTRRPDHRSCIADQSSGVLSL